MKHQSIFNTALRRLTIIYVWLAVLVTLTFTIPPMIAAERAREKFTIEDLPMAGFTTGEGATMMIGPRFKDFVDQRDDTYNRRWRSAVLEINGLMLLLAIGASYFLARRSLEPLNDVLETQEQFAAELAHELKTPLATVLLELESFARGHDNITAAQKKELRLMAQSIRDVGQLTEQTLSLMAVERDEQPLKDEPCDLAAIAREAAALIEPAAREKSIKLTAPADSSVAVTVMGRALQLRQLVTILLDNAIKYTPKSGQVMVTVQATDGQGSLTVKDTGPGIPIDEQAKIFERWYQRDGEQSGAGLGLAIARRIAEANGGDLTVESEVDGGASFTLALPLS
jgi:signal transduction histidine kinase